MRSFLISILTLAISVSAKAQLFGLIPMNKFEAGYYYDLSGNKIEGKIAGDASSRNAFASETYILFKNEEGTKTRITPAMMKSFVVGLDSFTVSHGAKAQFYRVILNDSVKVYSVSGFSSTPGMMTPSAGGGFMMRGGGSTKTLTYYYGVDPDHLTELDRKNYRPVLTELMSDHAEIADKIKNKRYRYGDLERLFEDYKGGK